jgi:hypothetical protein
MYNRKTIAKDGGSKVLHPIDQRCAEVNFHLGTDIMFPSLL